MIILDDKAIIKVATIFPERVETYNEIGQLHSFDDEPSVNYITGLSKGRMEWHCAGLHHRDNGQPAYICPKNNDNSHTKKWYKYGMLHSYNGNPAVVNSKGTKKWYLDGKKHRDVQPAITKENGDKYYYLNGLPHSFNDQPAVDIHDGCKVWCEYGLIHRDGDKPALIDKIGNKFWYKHGNKHRCDDKPACIYIDHCKEWYINGLRHRESAAAVFKNTNHYEFWLDGKQVTKEKFNKKYSHHQQIISNGRILVHNDMLNADNLEKHNISDSLNTIDCKENDKSDLYNLSDCISDELPPQLDEVTNLDFIIEVLPKLNRENKIALLKQLQNELFEI